MSIGSPKFLLEIDEAVRLPPALRHIASATERAAPATLQPASNAMNIEREFAGVQELLVFCCRGLHDCIENFLAPKSAKVDFGIKLAGETGLPLISKASGETNFAVTVTWKPKTANLASKSIPVADSDPSES